MGNYDPTGELKELINKIRQNKNLEEDNVLAIMTSCRNLMEQQKTKDKYPVLNLYCSWCVHPKIDRDDVAHDILCALPTTYFKNQNTDALIKDITALLSIPLLRKQLLEIFDGNDIDNILFVQYDNWQIFLWLLIKRLIGRPLKFYSTKSKKKYDNMVATMGIHSGFAPKSLSFQKEEKEGIFTAFVVSETQGGYFLKSPLIVTEDQETFES